MDYDCVFNMPTGLDVDTAAGFVYVADFGNNAIRQVSIGGIGGNTGAGSLSPEVVTVAEDPLLNSPYGVVVDTRNQVLYVTSFNGHSVWQIVLDGYYPVAINYNHLFAGSESGLWGHVDGVGLDAVFMNPTGIAMDDNDNLYINEWYVIPGELTSSSSGSGGSGTATGGTAKRHLDASAGAGAGSAHGSSSNAIGDTSVRSIDWGHEPQYLHNVRQISLGNSYVRTIAGSIIRKS